MMRKGTLQFNGTASGSSGNGFADFLTGNIYSFEQSNALPKYYERYKIVEPYFQDDWHVNKQANPQSGSACEPVRDLSRQVQAGLQFGPRRV